MNERNLKKEKEEFMPLLKDYANELLSKINDLSSNIEDLKKGLMKDDFDDLARWVLVGIAMGQCISKYHANFEFIVNKMEKEGLIKLIKEN